MPQYEKSLLFYLTSRWVKLDSSKKFDLSFGDAVMQFVITDKRLQCVSGVPLTIS